MGVDQNVTGGDVRAPDIDRLSVANVEYITKADDLPDPEGGTITLENVGGSSELDVESYSITA